jgi:hypothetical protein
MSEELKPCPFCEKQHEWTKAYSHYGVVEFIQCGKFIMFEHGITEKVRKDKAIELYNTRSIEDQLKAENEKLKETLREIANTSSKYELENYDDNSNNYWEWDDNALELLVEIDHIVKKAWNEVTK